MTRAEAALARAWYSRRPTFVATLLRPLSWIFGAVAALRRAAYRAKLLPSTRVPVPVVVVGNITVGGAGKTPLVAALAEALAARGRHPGVLSRGYGRRTRDVREAGAGDDPRDVGDEPLLLAAAGFPLVVGSDRAAAAQSLLRAHPEVDVLLSDDGLQHYALARDVEIAVVDAARGLGNGLLLPAGPLRETASRLHSVDALVWRTAPGQRAPMRGHPHEFVAPYEPRPWVNVLDSTLPFDEGLLADPASVAIAGIADPASFFDALRARGFRGETRAFADHHAYARDDVAFVRAPAILMTQKDAVKCRAFADARMWMLPIRARVEPALVDFVVEKIDGPKAPRNAGLPGHQGSPRS
ncbi:MAG TPA: tetraacyldisaccharide 4'-kinase [Casimicrobiaceae bacterium]|nr:tetraacyldisaccharide 4'-kinase [Casimicrobiaceae bacterium]